MGILSWAFGSVAKPVAKRVYEALMGSDLDQRLRKELKAWAASLPPNLDLVPEALFPDTETSGNLHSRPALTKLQTEIRSRIPDKKIWFDALLEQWTVIKNKQGATPFFRQTKTSAIKQLEDLADKFEKCCHQDEKLFRTTVIQALQNLPKASSDRKIAERILTVLTDRGVLYAALDLEHPAACYKSARTIRGGVTKRMEKATWGSSVYTQAERIRSAAGDFMRRLEELRIEQVQYDSLLTAEQRPDFYAAIETLRKACAEPISLLCKEYDIPPTDKITDILKLLG